MLPLGVAGGCRRPTEEGFVGKEADQIRSLVEPILVPGEQLVAVARVNENGAIAPGTGAMPARARQGRARGQGR
jgi:hypothetical protein